MNLYKNKLICKGLGFSKVIIPAVGGILLIMQSGCSHASRQLRNKPSDKTKQEKKSLIGKFFLKKTKKEKAKKGSVDVLQRPSQYDQEILETFTREGEEKWYKQIDWNEEDL